MSFELSGSLEILMASVALETALSQKSHVQRERPHVKMLLTGCVTSVGTQGFCVSGLKQEL